IDVGGAVRTAEGQLDRSATVGVDEAGGRIGETRAPASQGADDRAELLALFAEDVLSPRWVIGVKTSLDQSVLLHQLELLRQHVRRNAGERILQVLEAAWSTQQIADDQQGPALADQLERFGNRTSLSIQPGHFPSIRPCQAV